MALPAWPGSVPSLAREGWQIPAMFIAPLSTVMEGGNQRLRSQPGNNVAIITYPLIPLTGAQWADLETFFRTTLSNGASRWTMSLLTGVGYQTKTVQLDGGKPPSVSQSSALFDVVLPLRVYGM